MEGREDHLSKRRVARRHCFPASSRSSANRSQTTERLPPPGHVVNKARCSVEVLDRSAPRLGPDQLHRLVLGEDADVVDLRQVLAGAWSLLGFFFRGMTDLLSPGNRDGYRLSRIGGWSFGVGP